MKKIIFPIATVFLAAAAAALIAEAALRVYGLFDKNRGLKNCMGDINRKYCFSFKPNSRFRLIASKGGEYNVAVRINNYGFRGKDISREKKEGTVRILVMGDSFTFGVGAEEDETIPSLIERYLNDEGIRAEVINAGFGNYSPLLHYVKARGEYADFHPDIAAYFYDFSDLADDWRGERSLVYDKSGRIARCDPAFTDGKFDWWKAARMKSRLCSYIHNKVIRLVEKIRILGLGTYLKAKMEGKHAKALIVDRERSGVNPIEFDGYLMIRGRDRLPLIKDHFTRSEKYLDLLKGVFAAQGSPMLLVIYPYGIHVGPRQWGKGRTYWGFEEGRVYDDHYAFDILEDYARRSGLPCINLLPDFLANRDTGLFFDLDGHFTPAANRIAARAVVNNAAFRKEISRVLGRDVSASRREAEPARTTER